MRSRDLSLLVIPALLLVMGLSACGEADTSPVTIDQTRTVAAHDQHLGATPEQRFGAPAPVPGAAADRMPAVEAGPAPAGFSYTLPEGWTEAPAAPMRQINLRVPGGGEAYLSVTRGGEQAVRGNLDRWLGQLGQPPLSDAAFAALPRHPMLGGEARLLEAEGSFRGMGMAEAQADYALHGLILPRGDDVITIKLVGPAEVVAAQHPALLALAASLEAGR